METMALVCETAVAVFAFFFFFSFFSLLPSSFSLTETLQKVNTPNNYITIDTLLTNKNWRENSSSFRFLMQCDAVFHGNVQSEGWSVVGGAKEGGAVFGPRQGASSAREVTPQQPVQENRVRNSFFIGRKLHVFILCVFVSSSEFAAQLVGFWTRQNFHRGASHNRQISCALRQRKVLVLCGKSQWKYAHGRLNDSFGFWE
jgi:hypothetical protein